VTTLHAVCFSEGWQTHFDHSHLKTTATVHPWLWGWERRAKRGLDIMVSLLAIALLSPLAAIIAIGIKMTSKGPVLFRQARVGQFGKKFEILKFRSMTHGNDEKVHQNYMQRFLCGLASHSKETKEMVGQRVTPLGRLLRRASLDELPQFVNVLRGEMSLVGPRPSTEYEFESFSSNYRQRVTALPGLTGLWQVSGRKRVSFEEMVRLDLDYVRNWSIAMDLKIMMQTPNAVISGDGAY